MSLELVASRHEMTLARLARVLRDNPDTGGGVQLRQFLWSLYNMHHVVNLWTLVRRLDGETAGWAAEVMDAALRGELKESEVKKALVLSGELERWPREQPPGQVQVRLEEARGLVEGLLSRVPPGPAHAELAGLLRRFTEAGTALTTCQGTPSKEGTP
jgi:hypothetical protein